MADGAVIIGSYDPYALIVHGELMFGTYDPYPLTVHGAAMIGIYGTPPPDGTLPTYNPSIMTAVKRVLQDLPFPQFVMAGQGTGSLYQLFKKSDIQKFTVWRTPVYQIGKDFDVMEITFNLIRDLDVGMTIIPKIYFDNERSSTVGTIINYVNYSDKLIKLTSKNFDNSTHGKHNFFLELQFAGDALQVVSLPINIDIEEYEN